MIVILPVVNLFIITADNIQCAVTILTHIRKKKEKEKKKTTDNTKEKEIDQTRLSSSRIPTFSYEGK